MDTASSAALMAPGLPMASVPTGTPPGICTMDRSESSPLSALLSMGTPITGNVVNAAATPGRCAASPAPAMITRWCDFLDRQGILPDGSKAYYVINCFASLDPKASAGEIGPDMEMHNTEMAYTFALGIFFTRDRKRQEIYRKRFKRFLELAVTLDVNRPARAFNWAFQFTSQLIYFMQHAGAGLGREPRI